MNKTKYYYNNLCDSIITFLLTIVLIGFFVILIVGGNQSKNINKTALYICGSLVFIPAIVASFTMLLLGCFGKWTIKNDIIVFKKIFKKTCIKKIEITSITEKNISAIILGVYKTKAMVIQSKDKKISIYLNKKITADFLRELLCVPKSVTPLMQ